MPISSQQLVGCKIALGQLASCRRRGLGFCGGFLLRQKKSDLRALPKLRLNLQPPTVSLGNLGNDSEAEAAAAAADEVLKLVRDDLGLPWRLRDVGVSEADFDGIASDALEDLIVASNPRKVESKDQVIELLKTAW